jgi:hypothetical protein
MNVNANAIFPKKFFCTWENSSTRDVFSLDAHTRAKGVYAYPRAWILARKAYWSRTPGTGSSWGRRSTAQRRALSSLPPPGFIPNFFLLPGLLFCSQSLWYFVRFPSPIYRILSNTLPYMYRCSTQHCGSGYGSEKIRNCWSDTILLYDPNSEIAT